MQPKDNTYWVSRILGVRRRWSVCVSCVYVCGRDDAHAQSVGHQGKLGGSKRERERERVEKLTSTKMKVFSFVSR